MEKRLFSANPLTGLVKYAYLNPDNEDQLVIESHHMPQVHDLMEANAEARKLDDGKWGEGKIAARIPLDVYYKLKQDGIADDHLALMRWLRNPDNKKYLLVEKI